MAHQNDCHCHDNKDARPEGSQGHQDQHKHNHECECGHERKHDHECECGHDHDHECECGHDRKHDHECGCGHHHGHGHGHGHGRGHGHGHGHGHHGHHSHAHGHDCHCHEHHHGPVTAKTLEDAIIAWYESGNKDFAPMFDVLQAAIYHDIEIILPVEISPEALESMGIGKEEVGSINAIQEDVPMRPQFLENDKGETVMCAFTSHAELMKGAPTSSVPMSLGMFISMVLSNKDLAGALINPAGYCLFLPYDLLQNLWASCRPLSEAEKLLDQGSEAYNKGDFKTAVACYKKSAGMGNVTAMSNLGYCHYYGRSIPVNKKEARNCWEKAAVLGDICATYKLGDMYQNGDLPKDMVFAKAFYRKAFELASENKDLNSYPDACLRILKYCKEDCDEISYALIAFDAVNGFKERISRGDTYSARVFEQAMAIYDSIPKETMEAALASLEK